MSRGAADTIYALSSGNPPAAIAIVRISGPAADSALLALAGRLPEPRRASMAILHDAAGDVLDQALLLRFPGPNSATGEDLAELHLHGGRSVVAAVLEALRPLPGLRPALPGEFTRRAFENGRIDLSEAEGLADLLMAETESQRRAALALVGGALSRLVVEWQGRILGLAAQIEAALDFADEDDVGEELPPGWSAELAELIEALSHTLARPPIERLRDGVRVVIAGPPNAGKSSLLNILAGREAAITSAIAGTTRDLVEAPTAIGGAPFLLIDTAGLRDSGDEIETIGVGRARQSLEAADLILWLGDPADCPNPDRSILVHSKADLDSAASVDRVPANANGTDSATLIAEGAGVEADVHVSAVTGAGIDSLIALLTQRARALLPHEGEVAVNARHREALAETLAALEEARASHDLILASESLRHARVALDRITGRAGVEDMLDALFGTFCIGK